MKPKHIHIVVEVSYDCYRLQKNLAAAHTPAAARRIARQHGSLVIEGDAESCAMDGSETRHLWIQKMLVSVKP